MSCGLMPEIAFPTRYSASSLFRSEAVIGTFCSRITPSTTHTGALLPLMVDVPRMRIFGVALGSPDVFITIKPGICPCNIWSMEGAPAT